MCREIIIPALPGSKMKKEKNEKDSQHRRELSFVLVIKLMRIFVSESSTPIETPRVSKSRRSSLQSRFVLIIALKPKTLATFRGELQLSP